MPRCGSGVLRLASPRARLGWLLTHLSDLPGSGIIYTLTVSAAEDTARLLREAGHEVAAYTGRTDPAEREEAEAALKENRVKALVATSALGMGFDKPDLGLRGPSRRTVLAGRLLPAGGPCRPRRRARRRTAAARHRGPGHLAVLRHLIHAPRGPAAAVLARARRRPARRCRRPRWRRVVDCAGPVWSCCSRCWPSTARCAGAGRLGGDRPAVDLRRERYGRIARRGRPSSRHGRLRDDGRLPDGFLQQRAGRPDGRAVRPVRQLRRAVVLGQRRGRSRPRAPAPPCSAPASNWSRGPCGPRDGQAGRAGQGQDRRPRLTERPGAGPPDGLGLGRQLREVFGNRSGPGGAAGMLRACVQVLAQWGWAQRRWPS